MLIERIGRDADLDPLASPGNDREDRQLGIGDPHVVLQLRYYSAAPSSVNDHGSMNLASKTAPAAASPTLCGSVGDIFPAEIKPSLFIQGGHDRVKGPLDVDQPSRL